MSEPVFFQHFQVDQKPDGGLRELGHGAMGITYKAFDTNLQCPVALKLINASLTGNEHARERFLREARAAARLRHPNVATVLHLGNDGQSFFYAMEFIEGETLEALVARQGPLAPTLALEIIQQVARALGAAQNEGLVHRDIKPANLMLVRHRGEDNEGVHVKVIDFGLAKFVGQGQNNAGSLNLTMAGGFVGSPYFASPEQVDESEVDTRSDIYSLGATLWYLLAGEPPFTGSLGQVLSQHLQRTPPYEKLEARGIPAPVLALLRRMLAKNPGERPADPAALRHEVTACLRALGAAVSSSGSHYPPSPGDSSANADTAAQSAPASADATLATLVMADGFAGAASTGAPPIPPPVQSIGSSVASPPPPPPPPAAGSESRSTADVPGGVTSIRFVAAPKKPLSLRGLLFAMGIVVALLVLGVIIVGTVGYEQSGRSSRISEKQIHDAEASVEREKQLEESKKLAQTNDRENGGNDLNTPTPPTPPEMHTATPFIPPVYNNFTPPPVPTITPPFTYNGPRPVASYQARLSARDHRSSSGARLDAVADILRQDRANFYRFNERDPEDEGDPIFSDIRQRARFDNLTFNGGTSDVIVQGTPLVRVDVYPRRVMVTILSR